MRAFVNSFLKDDKINHKNVSKPSLKNKIWCLPLDVP